MESLAVLKNSSFNALISINRQITLVNKLLAYVNRDKVIHFLSQNELFFSKLISKNFAFDDKLLIKYSDDLDWSADGILDNQNIVWTKGLLKQFGNLYWRNLLERTDPIEILISKEFFPAGMSLYENVKWSTELIDNHIQKLESGDSTFPKFDDLSWSSNMPWSFELIERYKDYWNWGWQPKRDSIFSLSTNPKLPWSEELIDKYYDKWDWEQLSKNKGLPWTIDFLEKYKSKWKWGIGGLSFNSSLPWTISLIEKYIEKWSWCSSALSSNEGLPWSIQLLRRYRDKWDEDGLSENHGIIWTESMIEEVKSWGYSEINPYSTKYSPWNIDYIIKNYDFIYFHKVYEYESLWRNVFKEVLDYETISQIFESNTKKKSYKVFKERKQIDVIFDDFLSKKNFMWHTCMTKSEIILLKQYFKQKQKVYNYINSEEAFNDVIENRKSIIELQKLIDEAPSQEIISILSRKGKYVTHTDQFVFPQQHEMMLFLKDKLTLPSYFPPGANHTAQPCG